MPMNESAKKLAALVQSSGILNPNAKLDDVLTLATQVASVAQPASLGTDNEPHHSVVDGWWGSLPPYGHGQTNR